MQMSTSSNFFFVKGIQLSKMFGNPSSNVMRTICIFKATYMWCFFLREGWESLPPDLWG